MFKKACIILISTTGLLTAIYLFEFKSLSETPQPTYCAFCNPTVLENQLFYEGENVFALYTHRPIYPGHCLIIPKRHVARFECLSDAEISEIGVVIKKVDQAVSKLFGNTAYLLLQKNGPEAGQSVPHVHFHYIPRQAGQSSTFAFFFKMWLVNHLPPISSTQIHHMTEQLETAIN